MTHRLTDSREANSSILNSLLVILNERRFDNGEQSLKVPLWCAVAASNELPVPGLCLENFGGPTGKMAQIQ